MVGDRVSVRLLGKPAVERGGVVVAPPRGRKAWALLAYLLLGARPPGRAHLAQLLFGDAADPLGALRWTLAELRRAVGLTIGGDPVVVEVPPTVEIDVLRLVAGEPPWLPEGPGELLEGVNLARSGEFDSWLVVARHRLAAVIEARARHIATGLLAAGQAAEAVALAARAVAGNPLDEGNHELLVRALAMSGDRAAAARQVAVCEDLFRRELGVTPSPALRDAVDSGTATAMLPPVGGRGAVLSQLEAGRAAILAGAIDAGMQCLRRAAAEAGSHGDDALRARCLTALGSALVHSTRGRDEEGAVVLREALLLATAAGDRERAVTALRELGYVDVQAGRRASAEGWLTRATELADSDEELAAILGVRGMNSSDAGDYPTASTQLQESVEHARRAGDERQSAWSLSILGRAHLLRGETSQAAVALGEGLALVTRQRWLAFAPFPLALHGEVDLHEGDRDTAADHLERAWSLACQVGDPCWEGLAARGLGLLHSRRGEPVLATEWLGEAVARTGRLPDRYVWMLGYVLDAAAGHAIGRDEYERARPLVADLAALAARTGMAELVVRAHLHRHRLGDSTALAAARLLAMGIDNPALSAML